MDSLVKYMGKADFFPKNERYTNKNVKVSVMFGMPSKDCQFHGICKILPRGKCKKKSLCCCIKANVFINNENEIEFLFLKDKFSEKKHKEYFSSGYFNVFEAIDLPVFVESVLGVSFSIKVGEYPVLEEIRGWKVAFG